MYNNSVLCILWRKQKQTPKERSIDNKSKIKEINTTKFDNNDYGVNLQTYQRLGMQLELYKYYKKAVSKNEI